MADRFVSAVSFKTPPKDAPETCPWKNAKKVNSALLEQDWSGGLLFMGTDANSSDWNEDKSEWRCWYRGVNSDLGTGCGQEPNLGFTDPIYEACSGDWSGCIDGTHDTHRNKAATEGARIDFLFGKTRAGAAMTSDEATLPWGDPPYSDHRSVTAIFQY